MYKKSTDLPSIPLSDRDGEHRAEEEHHPLLRVGSGGGGEAGQQHRHQVAGRVAEQGLLQTGGLEAGVGENPQVTFPPPPCLGGGNLACTNMHLAQHLDLTWKEERREEIAAPPIRGEVQCK